MDSAPWYQAGLRFECSQCGDCCTGAPGFVWVNKAEIAELARQTGEENVSVFEEKYVRQVGIRKSLKEFANGDCVFFDGEERTCKVYDARPRQCRTWPFWDSNLKSPADWERTCQTCPGSGRGRLHQMEEIETRRSVLKI